MKIVPMMVEYVDHMGTDLSIVNAARVSFHKHTDVFEEKDARLIKYLNDHNHWTPFGHATVSLRVKAPIFVARQLVKHQVGLVWNEVSRRYVDEEPELFYPTTWRSRPVNSKQGSGNEVVSLLPMADCCAQPEAIMLEAVRTYHEMINLGVAPEQARMILPQNTMTEWIWTGSLAAFGRVCKLRLDHHTQQETREVAEKISDIIGGLFPYSWKELTK